MNIFKLKKPIFFSPIAATLKKLKNTKNNFKFLIQRINHFKEIYI